MVPEANGREEPNKVVGLNGGKEERASFLLLPPCSGCAKWKAVQLREPALVDHYCNPQDMDSVCITCEQFLRWIPSTRCSTQSVQKLLELSYDPAKYRPSQETSPKRLALTQSGRKHQHQHCHQADDKQSTVSPSPPTMTDPATP